MNGPSVGTLAMTSGVNGTRAAAGTAAKRQPRLEGPAGSLPGSDAAVDAGPSWVGEGSWRVAGPTPAPDLDHLCFPGAQCPWVPDTPTPSYAKCFPATGTAPPPPATFPGGVSQTSWRGAGGRGRGCGSWSWGSGWRRALRREKGNQRQTPSPQPQCGACHPAPAPSSPGTTGPGRHLAKDSEISPWRTLTPKLAHSPPPLFRPLVEGGSHRICPLASGLSH